MKITTLMKSIRNPRIFAEFIVLKCARWITNDKLYLSLLWWCRMGYKLDWENTQTFCEKIQWLKLNNRNPLYTKLVDKYAVKEYVAGIIGEEHVIPTLGVWDRPEDIDFGSLPNQFVLKTTHDGGGGGVVICKDKSSFDTKAAIKKLEHSYVRDVYVDLREWPYKDVPKRIIAEKYMEDHGINTNFCLTDYKFYCFDGEPKYCQVIRNRTTKETIDFYDMDWRRQEFVGLNPNAGHANFELQRPAHLETLQEMARSLSAGTVFSRVDLYEIDGVEYFGEITLFPASGLGRFEPGVYNELLGKMIRLKRQK